MSKKNKPVKDHNVKTFNITDYMMADLMFCIRPMKERQSEMMFWQQQLNQTQDDILRNQAIDPTKYMADWQGAYKTGKLVCTKIPDPVPVPVPKPEEKKDNAGK